MPLRLIPKAAGGWGRIVLAVPLDDVVTTVGRDLRREAPGGSGLTHAQLAFGDPFFPPRRVAASRPPGRAINAPQVFVDRTGWNVREHQAPQLLVKRVVAGHLLKGPWTDCHGPNSSCRAPRSTNLSRAVAVDAAHLSPWLLVLLSADTPVNAGADGPRERGSNPTRSVVSPTAVGGDPERGDRPVYMPGKAAGGQQDTAGGHAGMTGIWTVCTCGRRKQLPQPAAPVRIAAMAR